MEEIGPEATKRRRLGSLDASPSSYALQRSSGDGKPISDFSSHAFANSTLPPPAPYNQRPPPSPYGIEPSAEHRNYPDVQHRPYTHTQPSHSGYTTPLRDPRSGPPEPSYSRHHSVSGVTRSPVDNQPPSQLRPLNTTAANDLSHMPQYQPESTRTVSSYASFEGHSNGNAPHGLPLSNHHDSLGGYPQPGAYMNSPGTGPQTYSGPFAPGTVEIASSRNNAFQPRKTARATQACDTCRTRKARCDEGKPQCSYCVENGQQCNYKEVAPAKAERAQREILERLKALEDELHKDKADHQKAMELNNANLENQKGLLESLTQMLARMEKHAGSRPETSSMDRNSKKSEEVDIKPFQARRETESREQKAPSRTSSRGFSISSIAPQGTPPVTTEMQPTTLSSTTTSETSSDQLNDLQHGTAAHKLLRWPSIKKILDRRNSYIYREGFVTEMEERKGTLKPYGSDHSSRLTHEPSMGIPSPGVCSPGAKLEDGGRLPHLTSTSLHGNGGFSPPEQLRHDYKHNDHIGGLDVDGSLKMDSNTVNRLVSSYMANLHIMHPFLDRKWLQQMTDLFISQKPPATSNSWQNGYSPQFSSQKIDISRDIPNAYSWSNSKRKYESPLAGIRSDTLPSYNQPIERSISNAVVLLVLALGKICEHKGPLPGASENLLSFANTSQACSPDDRQDSPRSGPGRTSSTATTPSYSASNAQSPMNDVRSSHGNPLYHRPSVEKYNTASPYPMSPSIQGGAHNSFNPHGRSVHKIPGLAYYAYASDILGNEHGGIQLQHVQARLLAGLYMGQLACVIESWQWIQSACVVCILLTKDPSLKRYHRMADGGAIMDSIRFAYYSCLQLESDILAELDFPATPMEAKDGSVVDYPKNVNIESAGTSLHPQSSDQKVLACYSAQIYLRRSLNSIQRELYPPNHENLGKISHKTQKICEEMLEGWRDRLPQAHRWKDEDEPASEINEARLRAKYYGALYIIHRPFLYHALHNKDYRKASGRTIEAERYAHVTEDSHRPNGSMAPPREYIMYSAEKCIMAAMKSTIAFDGVCDDRNRLITTNIFGTAHAQFGNILVLAATYCTPHLRHLVPKEDLMRLIDRTTRFLRMQKNVSETLTQDARILETVAQTVNGDEIPTGSFSSE